MTDKEVYDLLDNRDDKICKRFDESIKGLARFIAEDNQEMKKSIDLLREKVEKQNSSVKHLNEWKAGMEGAEAQKNKGFDKVVRVLMFIIGFAALLATVYFGNNKTKKDVVDMLDQYSFDITTRSWEFDKDSI